MPPPLALLVARSPHYSKRRRIATERESPVGKLDRGLDEGPKRGWSIVSMKNDWKAIHVRPSE